MDSGTYDPNQQSMITFPSVALSPDDQPTTFGPVLFDVLKSVGDKIGGAQMLIGTFRFFSLYFLCSRTSS